LIALLDPLLKLVAPLLVIFVYSILNIETGLLSQSPPWLQILFALLFIELSKYWAHRLHHTYQLLWWLHAMHHSSERMYVLNGLRFHPLNYIANFAMSALPAMLLGITPEALLAYLAITQPVVLVQHANIDLKHGWLNSIFSTPEAHRCHHSTNPQEANSNYGNALLIWDHVFGTYQPANRFRTGQSVGLFATSRHYPSRQGYFSQLLSILKPSCCFG
jgi:ornithine lipid hydroxylase